MGKWMSGLEISKSSDVDPTKTTKTPRTHDEVISVVSVGSLTGYFQKSEGLHVAAQAQPQTAEYPTPAMSKAPPTPASASGSGDDGELEQLLAAAMRVCDYWGDSDQARAEMVADIKATPQHLRQDLLAHFLVAYGKAK
jgi:hypothetical protein